LREKYPPHSILDVIAKTITSRDAAVRFLAKKVKALLSKIRARKPRTTHSIDRDIENFYWSGYKYHRDEVMNNPELLSWVLKPNYLEESIP
jgi:hypothetical protein